MADDDVAQQPAPITPRPMPIRILAALAIVAILVLSMWAVIHAATSVKKTVRNDLTVYLIPATKALTNEQLRDAAPVVQRRARALGYAKAAATVNDGRVVLATPTKITDADVRTLGTTDSVENRTVNAMLPAGAPPPSGGGGFDGKRCVDLVDNKDWFWSTDKKICYLLGPNLLGGDAVAAAHANYNPQANGWGVDVTYRGNEFVTKVAEPNVGKNIAIMFGDRVLSAPVIEEGITGSNVRISGNFSEAAARQIAAVLQSGTLPARLVPE